MVHHQLNNLKGRKLHDYIQLPNIFQLQNKKNSSLLLKNKNKNKITKLHASIQGLRFRALGFRVLKD
jgi:hypothetical protein